MWARISAMTLFVACSSAPNRQESGFTGSLMAVKTPYGHYWLEKNGALVGVFESNPLPMCGGAIPQYLHSFRQLRIKYSPSNVTVNGAKWRIVPRPLRGGSEWIAKYGSPDEVAATPPERTFGTVTTLVFRGDDEGAGVTARITYKHTDVATGEVLCASVLVLRGGRSSDS